MSTPKFSATRRDLIKYSMFVGAALGLPRWKVFEALESTAGKAIAAEAAAATINRSLFIQAGNGALSYFTLLWPQVDVAAANNPAFAWHAPGQQVSAVGTDRPLTFGPQTPWTKNPATRQMTCMINGSNETHNNDPVSTSTISSGVGLFAASAGFQREIASLVPVIALGVASPQMAPGAPAAATVKNAAGMVSLFNSTASQMNGLLANTQDSALFSAAYKGFLALNAAAGKPCTTTSFGTGKQAAQLLGTNLASILTPSQADLARYGVTGTTPTNIQEFAKTLCTTAKAFAGGLTNSVVMPAMNDDPHGLFSNMTDLQTKITAIGTALQAFGDDLASMPDPTSAGTNLFQNTIISIHGDTPKNSLVNGGWPDGTANGTNYTFTYGAGYLKTGWFGNLDRTGKVTLWDPVTGADSTATGLTSKMLGGPAAAVILSAICKLDNDKVRTLVNGQVAGIVQDQQM